MQMRIIRRFETELIFSRYFNKKRTRGDAVKAGNSIKFVIRGKRINFESFVSFVAGVLKNQRSTL